MPPSACLLIHHEGTKESENHSLDPAPQELDVEVDQESHPSPAQSEVCDMKDPSLHTTGAGDSAAAPCPSSGSADRPDR